MFIGISLAISQFRGGLPAPYPAPDGYHWEYVTENGVGVTESGVPLVDLVRNQ
jgi:hypothetical protein